MKTKLLLNKHSLVIGFYGQGVYPLRHLALVCVTNKYITGIRSNITVHPKEEE